MRFVDPVQGDKLLGAFRAACGIKGASVIIHSPVGCHWGVNFLERMSSIETNSTISALRERNVIFGGEENIEKVIEIILKRKKEVYLFLLASSIPSIICEDWTAVIDSIDADIHLISMDCGGYLGKMGDGYEECLEKVYDWIEDPRKKEDKIRPSVNLIGLQRDIFRGEANVKELRRILGRIGVNVNSVFPPASLTELRRAATADLNVVLGYGKNLAEKMKKRWGMPWIYCEEYPYGLVGTKKFVRHIGMMLGVDPDLLDKKLQGEKERALQSLRNARPYLPALYGLPVAISADLPQATGMARFLSLEVGANIETIHVTSSPPSGDGVSQLRDICPEILVEDSWDKFDTLLKNTEIELIFGTDLEKPIFQNRGVPLMLFSYPTTSRVALTSSPYMGFRGVLTLMEEMVNLILHGNV